MRRTGLLLAIVMLTSGIGPAHADPGHEAEDHGDEVERRSGHGE